MVTQHGSGLLSPSLAPSSFIFLHRTAAVNLAIHPRYRSMGARTVEYGRKETGWLHLAMDSRMSEMVAVEDGLGKGIHT